MHRSLPALLALVLAGCGGSAPFLEPSDGPPSGSVSIPDLPGSPEPRPEPRSRYGNSAEYEVLGQRYRVMDTSYGYRERGEKHPLIEQYGVDARPVPHEDLDTWRRNFTGIQYLHEPTNFLIFGAIDDLWQSPAARIN